MALSFSIICPEAEIAKGQAVLVTAPGIEGEFGILEQHTPFATLLRAGCVIVEDMQAHKNYFYIQSGFLRADRNEVVILADHAAPHSQLDEQKIRQAISDLEDDLPHISKSEKQAQIKKELIYLQAQLKVIKRATSVIS